MVPVTMSQRGIFHIAWQTFGCSLFLLTVFFPLFGCRHTIQDDVSPMVSTSSFSTGGGKKEAVLAQSWWLAFNDTLLDNYIEQALSDNFTLQLGIARLQQAAYLRKRTDAKRYPKITGALGYDASRYEDGDHDETDIAEIALSWEIDLWGKLKAEEQAAAFDAMAAADALQGVALLLSVEVAQTYYQLVEQSLRLDLLKEQVAANQTSLDLIKLRFANGAASLVDVYQQQELVASVKTQLPLSEARLVVLQNRLRVLLGQPPGGEALPVAKNLPQLPDLPDLGIPADLLLARPDLRQLQREVVAADYRVAQTVADRLPSLKIGGGAGFINGDWFLSFFADSLLTIFDWGGKKSEVERQKAVVAEKMAEYSQRYLLAIEEVENSFWQERKHEQLLAALESQLRISKSTLEESRNRYVQGITDYLPVLSALVSRQNLERNILQRQQEHLAFRLLLYRALGGSTIPFAL